MRAVLIHSPLVGPRTLEPLAAQLELGGWSVEVPDLRDAVSSPSTFAARVAQRAEADLVVGHSGAGPFVPGVAAASSASTMVFVDAIVPAAESVYEPSASLLELLDSLSSVDGLLPAWHEWWSPEILRELVPDDAVRASLVAEMPQVPRSFFDAAVMLPKGWTDRRAAYVQLSPAYDEDRRRAEAWGWPTRRLHGRHLDVTTRPVMVAAEILDLVTTSTTSEPISR